VAIYVRDNANANSRSTAIITATELGGKTLVILPATTTTNLGLDGTITLDEADNVTISGLVFDAGRIVLQDGATNNFISQCSFEGTTTNAISFGNGNNGNNEICDNTFSGTTQYTIYSNSTGTNSANYVHGNTINNYFQAASNCGGIFLESGNTGWVIEDNTFGQSSSRTFTADAMQFGIAIESGSGYTISGNTIGGYTIASSTNTIQLRHTGIFLAGNAASNATSLGTISGNFIEDITVTSTGASSTPSSVAGGGFVGIMVGTHNNSAFTGGNTGAISIQGNEITGNSMAQVGAAMFGIDVSVQGAIQVGNTSANTISTNTCTSVASGGDNRDSNFIGIRCDGGSSTGNISNNIIENIDIGATATQGKGIFTGIDANFSSTSSVTISNNRIETITLDGTPISTATSNNSIGIELQEGIFTCSGNEISTITTQTNNGAGPPINSASPVFIGITLFGNTTSGNTISGNTISGINATNTTVSETIYVSGIFAGSSGSAFVSGNSISGLKVNSNSNSSAVVGIIGYDGTNTITGNNINMAIGDDANDEAGSFGIWVYSTADITTIQGNAIGGLESDNGAGIAADALNSGGLAAAGIYTISSGTVTIGGTASGEGNIISSGVINGNATSISGIHVAAGTVSAIGNQVYGLTKSASNAAAAIAGISHRAGTTTAINNMIALDNSSNADVAGIWGAAGTGNYYNNSIYISGAGTDNSFGIRDAGATTTATNTLIFHAATDGTRTAMSGVDSDDYTTVIASSAAVTSGASGTYTWRVNGGNAATFFTDFSTANLRVNNTIDDAWLVNGKGMPLTAVTTDIDGAARNTDPLKNAIAAAPTGPTDIGADEITPTTLPPVATESGSVSNGGTSIYTYAGRPVASVLWTNTGGVTGLTVRYYSGDVDPNAGSLDVSGDYIHSYWDATPAGTPNASLDYTISIPYGPHEQAGLASSFIVKWNGSWSSNASGQFTSFSSFTHGPGILPVSLVRFEAEAAGNEVALDWTTATELNNRGFEIQRSRHGNAFEPIAFVDGFGSTEQTQTYRFIDPAPLAGTSYYRLKQVDFDGSYAYSPVASVSFSSEASAFAAYPNPAKGYFTVSLGQSNGNGGTLYIHDIAGKSIAALPVQKGQSTVAVTQSLRPGLYLLRYLDAQGQWQHSKLVVE
jgi:hypothetical protein